ncbi:FAD-dependent oxidoreductase [soil metagenome]
MKVVVIGAGMVGARFADDLARLDPEAEIDVLGNEDYEPYNRILLTELLAGRVNLAGLALPKAHDRVGLWVDRPALSIDREARVVHTFDGALPYDHLVLATGARARVISVPGLRDGLPRGVHVLRTLNDAREISAATLNASHAVVVGGGALGIEAACGLRHRGVSVTLLVNAGLLSRDLDDVPGEMLVDAARDLGIDVVSESPLASISVSDGHTAGVQLADGTAIEAALVVLAVGAEPDVALAAEAGLHTNRGIVVDAELRTNDPHISAIGDCAETPGGVSGLLAPGWSQARALAQSLVSHQPVVLDPIDGAAMRLKAVGLSVTSMGRRASTAVAGERVVSMQDPSVRRFVEVVVRGDTMVGMTCVGDAGLSAQLSVQFDRPGILPRDPLHLLMGAAGPAPAESASPTAMPGATTVCRCNGVTKKDLVHAWDKGCTSVEELAAMTLATTGCGGCKTLVCGIVDWLRDSDSSQSTSVDRESIVTTG